MPAAHVFFVNPKLPKKIQPLQQLANNLYWYREADTADLFRRLHPRLWEECNHNPVLMLRSLNEKDLTAAANDSEFLSHLNRVYYDFQMYQKKVLNWPKPNGGFAGNGRGMVAFFSCEFGFTEAFPIYSGGLGLLAGDYLKSVSDRALPMVAVGLLYREGYFKQQVDGFGNQHEHYLYSDFNNFPLELVSKEDGVPLVVTLDFPGRVLRIHIWKGMVGRIPLYLLDTDCQFNNEEDRKITDRLYGGDIEKRIQQELVLGIGGLRALRAVGINPEVCHMNEGHSAFLALERIRQLMAEQGLSFAAARMQAASGNLFTTHTPVEAGIDIFPLYLIDKYFTGFYQELNLSRHDFLSLARSDAHNSQEAFNMAILALNLSDWANGVSRLHGKVAREMWCKMWPKLAAKDFPIGHVTNGVHTTTWVGTEMAELYDRSLGVAWRSNPQEKVNWKKIDKVDDQELWEAHFRQKLALLRFARNRAAWQLIQKSATQGEIVAAGSYLDPNVLTIGFARRFATYKRPTLLFQDRERLLRIIRNPERPVQLLFAGKAHPRDEYGKALIREIIEFIKAEGLQAQVIFLEDYDINIGRNLVQGVDLWVGNPRRPQEASSTSGMKAVANGALHVSTLDGWWDEAWTLETGWAIGSRANYENSAANDQADGESFYDLLEKEIIPLFYQRDTRGISRGWVAMVKKSISQFAPQFSTHRMLDDYLRQYYYPAAAQSKMFSEDDYALAKAVAAWRDTILSHWHEVRIETVALSGEPQAIETGKDFGVDAEVFLGSLDPALVRVEILYGPVDGSNVITNGEAFALEAQALGDGRYRYSAQVKCRHSGRQGYNIRLSPYHAMLSGPYQLGLVEWA
jgi:starch phosphorylase